VKSLYSKSSTGRQSLTVGDLHISINKGDSENAA
jgi:hypothetical protein